MKRILLSTASLGMLGLMSQAMMSQALAADLPYAKAPSATASVYDWTGVYVGVFGGGGYGNHNVNNSTGSALPFEDFTANYSSTGAVGGGEVGYNWQSGSLVVSVEGNLAWTGIKGSDANQFNAGNFPGVAAIDADNLRWTGALLAKAGYAVDRWLLYFEGGYAFGSIQHTNTASPRVAGFPLVDTFNVTANGLTGGGGIAYAVTNNIIAKFDYRYTNFNGYNRPGNVITGLTANGQIPYTTETTYSVVTLGIDFKFGGPVVAKY
jgi:outer membrane immunogenic protein